jgi:hypothetical protein
LTVASYRPETIVHDYFWNEAAFKQVELRLPFNNSNGCRLKRRHIRVPHSQCPAICVSDGSTFRWTLAIRT